MESNAPEKETERIYSNFDHELNKESKEFLQTHPDYFARHAAWNFNGLVWFSKGKWYEEIWIYHSIEEVLSGDTAEEVIRQANDEYGND